MFKHNLTAVLNSQRPNKKSEYPIRVRATINRVVSYYPTGVMVKLEQWNGEVIKHPNRVLLNIAIRTKINDLEKIFLEQSISGEQVKKIKKAANPTFKEYAEKLIKDQTGVLSVGRIEQKQVYLNKFTTFNSSIKLKDVTKDTMIQFENFCRGRNNSENTVHSNTSFLKSVLNAAVEDGIFSVSPGKGFKGAKYSDPLRDTLSAGEIELFEGFATNRLHSAKLLNVCNWFLFSCYCGLRYGDANRFKGFVNGKILLQTEKTNEVVSIFATDKIIQTRERITREIFTNQKVNEYLKIICAALGIEKKISFHNARHTFAVQFLIRGGRLEILSKILGHVDLKTTAIYAKISNNLADEEMKKVWG